ncbi:voltage-gated sodium channel, partial [Streptomyces sp. ZEA17I]
VEVARRALDDLERALADAAPGTGPPDRPTGAARTVASGG